jgi:hypothetical protein
MTMDKQEALKQISDELATAKAALDRAAAVAKEAGVSFQVPVRGSHFFSPVPPEILNRFRELKEKEGHGGSYYKPAKESTLTPEEDVELDKLYRLFDDEYYRPYQLREGGESYAYEYDGWWENSNC